MVRCPPTLLDMGHSPTGNLVCRIFLADAVLAVASHNWRAQVRARPASIEEARASERRGKSYDARLEAVVQEGTRWRIRK